MSTEALRQVLTEEWTAHFEDNDDSLAFEITTPRRNLGSVDNTYSEEAGYGVITEEDRAVAALFLAAPKLYLTLKEVFLHLQHRPGIRHRMDLFTADERRKIEMILEEVENCSSIPEVPAPEDQ